MKDLRSYVSEFKEFDFNKLVVVEENKNYEEGLIFQNLKQEEFTKRFSSFLSRYNMLNDLFMLESFVEGLESAGYTVVFLEGTRPLLEKYKRLSSPLEIEGFTIPNGGKLWPYQEFSLQKALDVAASGKNAQERFFFFGMGTGTGKSMISAAGAQELFNRDQVDLVIAFTLNKLKINLRRNFTNTTTLRAVTVEGAKDRRERAYEKADFEVLVTNYEKCYFDFDSLKKLVTGKRVLWVMDEVQKVIKGEGSHTKARNHLDKLIRSCERPIVWPMSASVVSQTPLKYYDLFSLHGRSRKNLLGPKYQFENDYLKSRKIKTFYTKTGRRINLTFSNWDKDKLQEVRHRVAPQVQTVRKTDPGIRELFKGMQTIEQRIQMSDKDRKLYHEVEKMAKESLELGFSIQEHVRVMQYICNTPEVLPFSESSVAKEIVAKFPELITSSNSSKVEVFLDQVEQIAEAGEKVVVFTQFTNLTLFTLQRQLEKREIKHVVHYGTGMSAKEAQQAQDTFKKDEEITVFLSSDAGAYGLNFQEARYVINYEPTYSYDTLMQRGDRINRADSYLDGLTSYVYLTDDSVEENVWRVNNARRRLASITQGTVETLDTSDAFLKTISNFEDGSSDLALFTLFGAGGITADVAE